MKNLTKENASKVSTIINVNNPEWGSKKFNYNSQPLNHGKCTHSFGAGCDSAILNENEFRFWKVNSFK